MAVSAVTLLVQTSPPSWRSPTSTVVNERPWRNTSTSIRAGPTRPGRRNEVVTVRTGALTALATGATITVGGTAYRVRDHLAVEHGVKTQIHCIQNP